MIFNKAIMTILLRVASYISVMKIQISTMRPKILKENTQPYKIICQSMKIVVEDYGLTR